MKRRKTFLLVLLCAVLYVLPVAADVVKSVELTTAGTLSTALTDEEKSTITHLTITGEINKLDFDVMKMGMESLTYIDLSGSTIAYYSDDYPANTIPYQALGDSWGSSYANTKISTFIFPSGVTSIGSSAFRNCIGLTGSLTIPEGVTSIGSFAFYYCIGFTGSLIIPEGITSIGESAFYDCSGFTGLLTISEWVNSIGQYAFSGCSGFTGSLTIPEGVTSIWSHAFSGCSGFTGSLTIPEGVTWIDASAFSGCISLDNIVVGNTTPCTLGSSAFPSNKVIYVPSGSLAAYKANSLWSSYTLLEEDVEATIHLDTPNTLALTVLSAGYDPTTITKLTLSGEVGDDDWALLKSNFTSLYYLDMLGTTVTAIPESAFSENTLLQSYIFPENTETIGSSAFSGCSGLLGSLTIPEGVTSIGWYAFSGCSGLTGSLTIPPEGVTSIGFYAFSGCSGLTSLIFEDRVTCIPSYAFSGCTRITTITSYSVRPPACTSGDFSSIDKENCILKVPSNSIAAYLMAVEWGTFVNITSVELPEIVCIAQMHIGNNGTVIANGTNCVGNSTTSVEVAAGENFTFTVIPDENCAVVSVVLDGVDITDQLVDNQYTVSNVQEDFTLNVSFEKLPAYITLSVWEQGATRLEMAEGSTLSLQLLPSDGWEINSVSYNGEDVTDELDEENYYTTPAIANGDALVVTYLEVGSSSVATTSVAPDIKVYASGANQITVVGTESGEQIAVYNVSGSAVAHRVASSDTEQLSVASGAVYIVRVAGYTFKLAL